MLAFFIAPYREHPNRPGRRVSSMDDASPDIGYEWSSLDIGDGNALVCVDATPGKLNNLATTYTRTTKPETLLSAEKVQGLRAEVSIDVRPRIAALMAQADAEGYVRLPDSWSLETSKLLVALGKLGYGLDRVSTGTFPTTPVIDAFTRADSTTSPGPSWGALGAWVSLGVLTNRAYETGSGGRDVGNHWNPGTFAADQETYGTITATPTAGSYFGMLGRIVNPTSTTTRNSQWAEAEITETDFNIYSETNNALTLTSPTNNVTCGAGDSLGLECIGTVITGYYKASGGSWVASLVRTAVHNQVGYLGMNIFKGAGADQFYDDFGGGTVVPSTTFDYSNFPKYLLAGRVTV
jgi:hypothetical protein